ncbi:MAG: hypothetical protein OHK0031_01160 [Anaerolineales bacterium]
MKEKRLGCMTPLAITATLITLLVIAATAFASGSGFFNAGSLNAQTGETVLGGVHSHAEIGSDCAKCHPAPWEPDSLGDRCAVCHTEITTQLADPASLHGLMLGSQKKLNCRSCHSEHKGPAAPLTDAEPKNFPHDKLKFALTSHPKRADGLAFACRDCHSSGFSAAFQQSQCADCHQQMDAVFMAAHVIEYGQDCLACHDGVETLGKAFDHNALTFPLAGKHAPLRCAECHTNARSRADLKNTSPVCESCHLKDDPHQGRFGAACGDCHNPAGWRDNVKFDHNLANFKLEGKHAAVACEKCHTNPAQFAGTPSTCVDCHAKDDKHNGQFGTDCAACHNPSDWKDAKVDHSLFAFKLDGAHVNVDCLKCHVNGVFKGTPSECGACHAKDDAHSGRFGMVCSLCHSTTAWKPATFDHRLSRFPLTGAHASLACEKCHANGQFTGTPTACAACHGEPAFHAGMFSSSCEQCHNTNNWNANYTGSHPGISDEGGSGVNHGGQGCRSCHTVNLRTATCTACHNGNPGGGD